MAERDENGRFAPGWEGGPGRPKNGESLTDVLRTVCDMEELAEKLKEKALGGDVVALKYIFDRWDGKPVETQRVSVEEVPTVVGFYPDDYEETAEGDTAANKE